MAVLNFIECEAHREVLIAALRESCNIVEKGASMERIAVISAKKNSSKKYGK